MRWAVPEAEHMDPGTLGCQGCGGALSMRLVLKEVGPDAIAFVHANDIWVVGRDGGDARRLTSGEGAETDPAFCGDGQRLAFGTKPGKSRA